jgi:DNA replication protein DnaC
MSKANTGTLSAAANSKKVGSDICPTCNGSGFVHPLLAGGKPDYSQAAPCKCMRKSKNTEHHLHLERYSNIGSLKRFTFDNLLPQGRSGFSLDQQSFEKAHAVARLFAANPAGWLVFIGSSGSGKTHLAAAIANSRLTENLPVLYKTVPDLLDDLRAAFNPQNETPYNQTFEQVRNTPLLILDDLGIQSSTAWAKEKLDQLLNHRYNHRLPTVITSSTRLNELDERLRNRMSDTQLAQVFTLEEKQAAKHGYQWSESFALQKSMTFKSFDWHRVNLAAKQRISLENAYNFALNYAKSPEGWLILQGVTGSGKTHLSSAIVNYQFEASHPALFIVVPEFLDHLRSAFGPGSTISYDELFEQVKTAPLLVLDDFGEQATTPWAQEKLYQVINYRYNAQLPTIITTRNSLEEIDSRISSRFVDPKLSTPFNIDVPDFRGDVKTKKSTETRRYRSRQS